MAPISPDLRREIRVAINWAFRPEHIDDVMIALDAMPAAEVRDLCVVPDPTPDRLEFTLETEAQTLDDAMHTQTARLLRSAARAHLPAVPADIYVTDDIAYQWWIFDPKAFRSHASAGLLQPAGPLAGRPLVAAVLDDFLAGETDRGQVADWAAQRDPDPYSDQILRNVLDTLTLLQVRSTDPSGQPLAYIYTRSNLAVVRAALAND